MKLFKNKLVSVIIVFFVFCFSSCAQINNHSKMRSTASKLIDYLKNCDTTNILALHDTSFTHIDKKNYRDFLAESIIKDCSFFNTVVNKYGMPDMDKIVFKKDSSRIIGTNILILPLTSRPDSNLNIKKCFIVLVFNPDKYFINHSRLLRYSINKEELVPNDFNNDKIETPDWLKKLQKKKN
ncbi:MAG: hypothetical protein ABJB11_11810 [Ferruginibacter sp.]